jgi:hypothetical protein
MDDGFVCVKISKEDLVNLFNGRTQLTLEEYNDYIKQKDCKILSLFYHIS